MVRDSKKPMARKPNFLRHKKVLELVREELDGIVVLVDGRLGERERRKRTLHLSCNHTASSSQSRLTVSFFFLA